MSNDPIKPSRWYYAVPGIVMISAITIFATNLVKGVLSMDAGFTRFIVPGKYPVHLDKSGHHTIYYEYESVVNGQIFSTSGDLRAISCSLSDTTSGQNVALQNPLIQSTYNISNKAGRSVFVFDTTHEGNFEFACSYPPDHPGENVVFVIGPDIGPDIFKLIFKSLATMFGGAIVAAGIAVWITRKRNAYRKQLATNAAINSSPQAHSM